MTTKREKRALRDEYVATPGGGDVKGQPIDVVIPAVTHWLKTYYFFYTVFTETLPRFFPRHLTFGEDHEKPFVNFMTTVG